MGQGTTVATGCAKALNAAADGFRVLWHLVKGAVFCGLCATAVVAQGVAPVPERRSVVTEDVDFRGADLGPVFDTTPERCERLCLARADCAAFTYNSRSNACFPKAGVTRVVPYEGAFSARIVEADPQALARAGARAVALDTLRAGDFDAARALAQEVGRRHSAAAGMPVAEMLEIAQARQRAGDFAGALRWTGAAVAHGDEAAIWAAYARLSLRIGDGNARNKRRMDAQALSAALNAYLRARTPEGEARALSVAARALERLGRGRDTIDVLRLAQVRAPLPGVAAALERAVARFGFRITGHSADNESAAPRICAEFSEPLVKAGLDYTPYLRLPDPGLAVIVEERQLCLDGVRHGERYRVTFRAGLPAASGEVLAGDTTIAVYVRDRAPFVRFPGRAYVLPRASGAALPVETVNLDEVALRLRRVSDRNLLRSMQEGLFARPLSSWQERDFTGEIAEEVWIGTGEVENVLNRTMTTRLPLSPVLKDQPPGIYALSAARPDGTGDEAAATQWFVLSDLGLTTLSGQDGLHVFVRSLTDAAPRGVVGITLLSRANRVLATATTDAQGHARLAPGLMRGTGGAAPALVLARAGDGAAEDMTFLSLTEPAFDLSDRGVEGRAPAGPVDVFLTTDRGAYRAGEVIHATALARDAQAQAIPGLPLTAILTRPDGVEYARHLSAEAAAGGHVFAMKVGEAAPRGTWTVAIHADVEAPALARQSVLVEDFLPERLDMDLSLPDGPLDPDTPAPLGVTARYLFGAPGARLDVSGRVTLRPAEGLDAYPGYTFGRHDEIPSPRSAMIEGGRTDAEGRLRLPLPLPDIPGAGHPLEAVATVTVQEGSGRPVERRITRPVAAQGALIGIRPGFDGVVPEGSEARFALLGLDRKEHPAPMDLRWTVNRVETRYQWYQEYGRWSWEPVTRRVRVATGTLETDGTPAPLSVPVDWGRYELIVERMDGDYVAASVGFDAGWFAPAGAADTPDMLEMSLDKPRYRSGDTAMLRLVPRRPGKALITVMADRVIHMEAVDVPEGASVVPLTVTDDWGTGAYVTAQVIRPMNVAAGQTPARALGLAHAAIDPGDRQLAVRIDAPEAPAPRGPMGVAVEVDGVAEGETAYVTLAAVDLGILNLTGFEAPDPSAHYFGQRRLGVEIRDLYGRLIDGMSGAEGRVRSGGDGGAVQRQAPPPEGELMARFTGPLAVGPDGVARATVDLPDFNGTVRLMAVAWSPRAVGQAARDVLVRDPVVLSASLPRFLAPGDESRMRLEITHADGPAGPVGVEVSAGEGLRAGDAPATVDLAKGGQAVVTVPVTARHEGTHDIHVTLTTPDGKALTKRLSLSVRANDPAVSVTRRFSLAPGDTFTLDDNVFAGLRPGSARAVVSAGPLARLDAPGLLAALDRYPYGCTEQVASAALPLLYFDEVAEAMGLAGGADITARIGDAVRQVLSRQGSGGSFGLWQAGSGDFWLDAYVTDVLSRARAAGHAVPERAFAMALDNLRNRIAYAPDFDRGGEDIAYALMVLAREGAAAMGDLRYYADVKADAFATPLSLAQLGAALAAYGDPVRADRLFSQASARLAEADRGAQGWRSDYGSALRDRAGLLTLAAEAGSEAVDRAALAAPLAVQDRRLSTQEQAWTLMAAHALIDGPGAAGLSLDGLPVAGPMVRVQEAGAAPQAIRNDGTRVTDITLSTLGVPKGATPVTAQGYAIERRYFTLDGAPLDADTVQAGTRLVAVLRVTPATGGGGRLMVDDALPAGLEIDNPNLLRAGDIAALDWLDPATPEHAGFREDRFLAAVDLREEDPFELAYIVRAVTPGSYHHPAALVEDMYRPALRATTASGRFTVTP
ncbi:MG2 domain-containing protein [Roseovarius ramblicola]|uniref:MG2 domain-containing protein n=1 Tax=Roseovarius ramblicola TaxID=2022336 RepID=A0ABV5I2C1_9RHOB